MSKRAKSVSRVGVTAKPGRKTVRWLDVKNLLLDSQNLRLPEELHGASQKELLKVLSRDYSLIEIGRSLADHGYFSEEPLVAIPAEKAQQYIVVEGNRRLAALRLLLDPSLAREFKLREWTELAKECQQPLDEVPVLIYEDRDQVTPYLGFRHISGVLKWEPIAKARFIDFLIKKRKKAFSVVAREVGMKTPTIRNNYAAYRILIQGRDGFGIDTSKAEDDFSVLYRALSAPAIRKYIGLDLDRSERQLEKPIPGSKGEELRNLLSWMFGDEVNPPAMKESRQITELSEVLGNAEATRALKVSRDLSYSYRLVGGEERRLLESLENVAYYLDEALRDVHRHKKSRKVQAMVSRCYQSLREIVKHFPKIVEEEE